MPPEPMIRLAAPGDAAAIAALSRDRIETGLGWRWTPLRVRHSIVDADTNAIVAAHTVAGDPAATPLLGFGIMKYADDDAHLLLLAVQATAGRRGIGRAMVEWLEASARVAGLARVHLEARAGNAAARAFYARLGYRETAVVAGYYAGREDCIRLIRALRPAG